MEKDGPLPQYSDPPPPYSASAAPTQDPRAPYTILPPPSYFSEQNFYNNVEPGLFLTPSREQARIIIQQPAGTTAHVDNSYSSFGANPKSLVCRRCDRRVTTKTIQQPEMRAHLFAVSLCLVGCWPCVPCIYFTDCCTNTSHYCPSCNAYLGTHLPRL